MISERVEPSGHMKKPPSILPAIRPFYIFFGAYSMVGTAFLASSTPPLAVLLLLALFAVSGEIAVLLLDDFLDLKIDRLIHPDRPLVAGTLPRGAAFTLMLLAGAVTVGITFLLDERVLIVVVLVFTFVLVLAHTPLRRIIPTSPLVNMALAISLLVPYLAVGSLDSTIVLFMVMNFLWDVGHDVVGDMFPEGEVTAARPAHVTIPQLLGEARSASLVGATLVAMVPLGLVLSSRENLGLVFVVALTIGSTGYAISIFRLMRAPTPDRTRETRLACVMFRLVLFTGIILARLL